MVVPGGENDRIAKDRTARGGQNGGETMEIGFKTDGLGKGH